MYYYLTFAIQKPLIYQNRLAIWSIATDKGTHIHAFEKISLFTRLFSQSGKKKNIVLRSGIQISASDICLRNKKRLSIEFLNTKVDENVFHNT